MVCYEVFDVFYFVVYSLEVVYVNFCVYFYFLKNKVIEKNWVLNWCYIVYVNFELIIIE